MYFDGTWTSVSFDAIDELAEKGTDIVFIEKEGVPEVLTEYADKYGISMVNTRGYLTEYGKGTVFGKPMVQTTIFKNAYRTLKLDDVSKAVLGDGLGGVGVARKYKGLTGKDIQTLPIEEQKKYVLRDAELVMQLSKHNNGEVLNAMKATSELTGLDFERVCRTGIST